jgi:hypothetical protein
MRGAARRHDQHGPLALEGSFPVPVPPFADRVLTDSIAEAVRVDPLHPSFPDQVLAAV